MNRWGRRYGYTDYVAVGSTQTVRLDDLVAGEPVDVIKMDVEGMEAEVAKGWERLFNRRPPFLVLTEFIPSLIAEKSNASSPLAFLRFFLEHDYIIRLQKQVDNVNATVSSVAVLPHLAAHCARAIGCDLAMQHVRSPVSFFPVHD